jgi:ATP-dependent Clp protease adaptor protein ClpS
MSATEIKTEEKTKQKFAPPKHYKVIFLNDDITPMDFVVELLIAVFKHSDDTARTLTMKIHEEGSSVVGVFGYEIAEQKAVESTALARDHGFPLKVRLEESV